MTHEHGTGPTIDQQVDEIFIEVAKNDAVKRIEIAAFVLGSSVLNLYEAKQQQMKAFEEYTKNTKPIERQEAQLFGAYVIFAPTNEFVHSDEPSDIEKAEQALRETKKEVRSLYDLTVFQMSVAHRMSRVAFL